jgi:pimeloyl-ACP methyl ester carboxylesterase
MSAVSAAVPPVAIVLLHHFGGSARTWDGVVGRLRDEYDCVTPDLRGFGAANEAAGPYTLVQYAEDVDDLVERLGFERYVLVGHSMGGKIALAFAARRPAGLAALVLLAPSPPTPEPMSEEDRAAALAGHGDRDASLATIAKITAGPLSTDLVARTADDMVRSSKVGWTAWLERGSREDISASIDGLAVPTLIVSGAADSAIPAGVQSAQTLPCLRKGRLAILAGKGHLLPVEAPEAVADYIRYICRNITGGSADPRGGVS